MPRATRYRDDTAPIPLSHARHEGTTVTDHAGQIDVDYVIPNVISQLLDGPGVFGPLPTGIADEDVNIAELLKGFGGSLFADFGV